MNKGSESNSPDKAIAGAARAAAKPARLRSLLTAMVLTGGAALAASPAWATVDPLVSQALALEQQGKPGEAFILLAPQAATRAGDPDFDYALGLAAADSHHPGEAIAAFERVLAVQPDNSRARAEIARVYAMSGDIDSARDAFDTVQNDPTVPDPVRNRIGKLVRDYDRQIGGGGTSLTGFGEAEAGYDSNVNTATGLTSITLPIFAFLGPASLNGAATRMHDGFYQLQGGISAASGLSRQDKVYASVLGNWRDNFNSSQFDQAAVTGTAGISHTIVGGPIVSLSGQLQRFWLGHNGYRTAIGGIARAAVPQAGGTALSFQGQYFRYNYDGDQSKDADRITGSVDYSGKRWFAGIGGGRERTIRAAARHLGYWFAAAQAGAELPVDDRLAVLVGGSVEHRDYRATDPLFLRDRRDTQADASLGLRYIVAPGISLRPRATYTRNFSDIALYDFSRVTASLALRAEF